jgi:hypothetical protein
VPRGSCGADRDEKGIDPTTFPTYQHRYEDGRVVNARLYPNTLLADFRAHFHVVWLPLRCQTYFLERDASALPYLWALLPAPAKAAIERTQEKA